MNCVTATLAPLALDRQAEGKLHQACKNGNLSAARLILCQRRVDVNCKQSGWTPLMRAAENGHLELMKFLVSRGANVSLANTLGDNTLHLACENGPLKVVQYILSLDVVDINSRGWKKRTPVMLAGFTGRVSIVDVLVRKGGDLTLVDEDSNSILHLACEGGQGIMALFVLSLGLVDINSRGQGLKTPVMVAAEAGYSELVETLVRKEANASLVDIGGNNLLHLACAKGNIEVVRFVLSQALIDINSRGHNGKTPLMLAVEEGHRALVELLVNEGAHALLVDTGGNNVLHLACENGYVEVAQYILSHNLVNIDVKNLKGQTAVVIAHEKKITGLFDHLYLSGGD
ncbi:putative ankyrin repeat protein RF_0381 [Haliotis asinina]|uniref:putative ankyrin repeat protein RF_0381 n=1 Tax=Haliotis asinina TaxID=109174 RepID=UPI00353237E1